MPGPVRPMKARLLNEQGEKTYILIFSRDDEVEESAVHLRHHSDPESGLALIGL